MLRLISVLRFVKQHGVRGEENSLYSMTDWFERELSSVNSKCLAGSVPSANLSSCMPCLAGEYRSLLVPRCIRCPQEMYSKPGAESCEQCLDKDTCSSCGFGIRFAECSANQTEPLPRADFYRLPGNRMIFAPCEPGICLGGNTCKWPNRGILCGQCESGFTNGGSTGHCDTICPDITSNIIRVAAILAMYSIYVSIVVKVVQNRSKSINPKNLTTIVVRLIMNYLALFSTALRFIDLDLPSLEDNVRMNLKSILNASEDPTEAFMNMSCIFRHYDLEPVYAYAVLGNILLPCVVLACAIGTCLSKITYHLGTMAQDHLGYRASSSVSNATWYETWKGNCTVALFIFHPMATKLLFKGLECQSLDTLRLTASLDIECTSIAFQRHAVAIAIGIMVWSFGIPGVAFFVLFRHHRAGSLNEQHVRNQYAFLYNGFEPKYWYFEVVYAIRKVLFMSVFVIPYMAIRSTVMICLGVAFLAVHLNCEPFDNRSFFVLDKLETRNLRAFNSSLLCQLVVDAVTQLRTENVDATAFPASFLLSGSFRGLMFFALMIPHFLFVKLAVSTMFQERILKPNLFLVAHAQLVLGSVQLPSWRKWLMKFEQHYFLSGAMKFDEENQVLHFGSTTTKEEREFVISSLGEFLTTNVMAMDDFNSGIVANALRHAVHRVYRYRANLLQQLKHSYARRSQTFLAAGLKKALSSLKPTKSSCDIVDCDTIPQEWLIQFRQDGFTAEELNGMLSTMTSQVDSKLFSRASQSSLKRGTATTFSEESSSPKLMEESSNTSSRESSANMKCEMKDCGIQTNLAVTNHEDLKVCLVIDEYMEKTRSPKDCRTQRNNLAGNPGVTNAAATGAVTHAVTHAVTVSTATVTHAAATNAVGTGALANIVSRTSEAAIANRPQHLPQMAQHRNDIAPAIAIGLVDPEVPLPEMNRGQIRNGFETRLPPELDNVAAGKTKQCSHLSGPRSLDENSRTDSLQAKPRAPSASLHSIEERVSVPFHKPLFSTLTPAPEVDRDNDV